MDDYSEARLKEQSDEQMRLKIQILEEQNRRMQFVLQREELSDRQRIRNLERELDRVNKLVTSLTAREMEIGR